MAAESQKSQNALIRQKLMTTQPNDPDSFPAEDSWPPENVEIIIEKDSETFYLSPQGVFVKKGAKKWKLCGYLKVLGCCENGVDNTVGKLISFLTASGKRRTKVVKNSACLIKPQTLVSQLVNSGLEFNPSERGSFSMLGRYLYYFPVTQSKPYTLVDKCGWFGNCYVTPFYSLSGRGNNKKILFSQAGKVVADCTCKGKVEDWIGVIGPIAPCSPLLVACLCYSFSAPLIGRVYPDMGSSGLYLAGSSSSGKTTCGLLAESIYGNPFKRAETWDVSNSSIQRIAVLRNHSFVLIDETKTSRCSVMDAIYSLSGNKTASRSNQDGTLRPTENFQITYICTGETSLANLTKLQSGRDIDAGAHVRCLNVDCDSLDYGNDDGTRSYGILSHIGGFRNKGEFFRHIYSGIEMCYGTVGREWIKQLAKIRVEKLSSTLKPFEQKFWSEINSIYGDELNDQSRRVLLGLQLRAAAGELATEKGLTGWKPGLATKCCVWLFKEWRKSFSGVLIESEQVISRLSEICQQLHLFALLSDRNHCAANILGYKNFTYGPNGEICFLGRKKERLLFLLTPTFNKIAGNSSQKKAFEILKGKGVMEFSVEGGRERKDLQISGGERFYTVNYDKYLEFIAKNKE